MAIVEMMLSTTFWAVPAFSRVEPAMISGPVTSSIGWSTWRLSSASGFDEMPTVRAPTSAAWWTAPIVYGVRPDAATPTTTSSGETASSIDVGGAGSGVVLDRLPRRVHRPRTTGEDADDAVRVERRWAFGGVEHAHPARRAGADVDQPPAPAQPLDDGIDRRGNVLACCNDLSDRLGLVLGHQRDELGRAAQVEVGEIGSALLGEEVGEVWQVGIRWSMVTSFASELGRGRRGVRRRAG